MTLVDQPRTDRARSLSRSFMVTVRSKGVGLPAMGELSSRPLGLAELAFLERLAGTGGSVPTLVDEVAETYAVDRVRLEDLAADLEQRGFLADADADTAGPVAVREFPVRPATPPAVERYENPDRFAMNLPASLGLDGDGYYLLDHEGRLALRLSAVELAAAVGLRTVTDRLSAIRVHRAEAGPHALREPAFDALINRLLAADLLRAIPAGEQEADQVLSRAGRQVRIDAARFTQLLEAIGAETERHDAVEAERVARTGTRRMRVVPVQHSGTIPPLALGMVMAAAKTFRDGALEEHFDLYPRWVATDGQIREMADHPSVFLFSNYVWSHAQNLSLSRAVKERNPANITIHGGPDTPRYEGDVQAYMRANPHVDITVRNEGEVTTPELLWALAQARGDGDQPFDLSVLADVPGLCVRLGDQIVRTPDRDRIVDLDSVPSPYLTGMMEAYTGGVATTAVIETNRGCPYGCTFCDWGSATASRIRKFSLERIYDELEWCAVNKIARIFVADANFGILERDVEIAQKVAELKTQYGYPRMFVTNYAKNTTKYVKQIVKVMVDAGILTEGILSLQSMDADTLATIRRSNIKLEKYEDLAREFRKAKLPLFVDLMLGLPGSSMASFKNDLQECVDREVTPKVHLTELLVNSPMNDPEYRRENKIDTGLDGHPFYPTIPGEGASVRRALVVSTETFTREEYDEMRLLRRSFLLCENFGVLRQVSRHVRQVAGIREVDFYDDLRLMVRDEHEQWPMLALLINTVPDYMAPPISWRAVVDELRRYLVERVGLADDSALDTVLRVQHALLPARGRAFPLTLELPHDLGAWHQAMIEVKDSGLGHEWPEHVPPLSSFGPGTFTIDDPTELCEKSLGHRIEYDDYGNWELVSPVARTMPTQHLMEE